MTLQIEETYPETLDQAKAFMRHALKHVVQHDKRRSTREIIECVQSIIQAELDVQTAIYWSWNRME